MREGARADSEGYLDEKKGTGRPLIAKGSAPYRLSAYSGSHLVAADTVTRGESSLLVSDSEAFQTTQNDKSWAVRDPDVALMSLHVARLLLDALMQEIMHRSESRALQPECSIVRQS